MEARYKNTFAEAGVQVIWTDLAAFFTKSMFVKQVLCHAVLGSTHTAQVGHPVSQLLYGLHLLVKVVRLDEVTQLKGEKEI